MFCSLSKTEILILATVNLSSANALNLVHSKKLSFGKGLVVYKTFSHFKDPEKEGFLNNMGKGENAVTSPFFFPILFLYLSKNKLMHLSSCLEMLLVWTSLKSCCLVKSFCKIFINVGTVMILD